MKQKIFTIVLLLTLVVFGLPTIAFANQSGPIAIETKEVPSETYLSKNKRSIGAEQTATTLSSPTRGLNQAAHSDFGWGNPFLPGEEGWETGGTGNVGYPVGDVSLPILLSMLLLYFVYRGVSSTKRKNNF